MAIPDYYVRHVTDISPSWFGEQGIDALIIDIDNTLLPRDTDIITPDTLDWFESVKRAGIKICLLTNTWYDRAFEVSELLDAPVVRKAVKPLPFAFLRALKKLKSKTRTTVVIGDQFFTDVMGATFLGMMVVMVLPLTQKDLWHTLLLRRMEHVIMRNRTPRQSL